MTGRGREVADLMERRKINVLCVQETRWKGNKARELGGGYKLVYSGADERGRNGVGVVLDPQTKEEMVEVVRKNSRIIRIKLVYGREVINVISAYAPQVGCDALSALAPLLVSLSPFWHSLLCPFILALPAVSPTVI